MRTRKYVKLYLLLLIIGLFLIACGGQPAEQEPISMDSEPLNSEAMDDGFADDTEPQLQHEIAMREKLDEAVMTKFVTIRFGYPGLLKRIPSVSSMNYRIFPMEAKCISGWRNCLRSVLICIYSESTPP